MVLHEQLRERTYIIVAAKQVQTPNKSIFNTTIILQVMPVKKASDAYFLLGNLFQLVLLAN
jgi:hypothetical protein